VYNGFPSYAIESAVATISFNSGVPDAAGSYWWLDGPLDGWDAPTARVSMLPRIGNDALAEGEIPGDLHYRGRTLKFALLVESVTEAMREASRYLLAGATDLTYLSGTFLATEETPKQLSVVRSGNQNQGRLTITEQGLTQIGPKSPGFQGLQYGSQAVLARAEVELYASDPRKYAQSTATVSAPSAIVNAGNTPGITGTITVTTGGSPFTLTVGSRTMSFAVPSVTGAPALPGIPTTLLINLRTRTITSPTGTSYYYLRKLTTPWIVLPAGSSAFSTTASAASITFRSAWI